MTEDGEPQADDRLLSVDEVSRLTGIPVATLYTWRSRSREKGPQAVKVGTRLRYRMSDVQRWLRSLSDDP